MESSVDTVAMYPTKDVTRDSPLTTAFQHSDSAVRQTVLDQSQATSKSRQHVDVGVKRRQIGLKRKSLQEMRHLLNTATITVLASVDF